MRRGGWRAWGLIGLVSAVAVVAAVALTLRQSVRQTARLAADECTIVAMREAIAVYYRLHGVYPEHPGRYADCAPLAPAQERALVEVRRLVDETARAYGVASLTVVAGPYVRGLTASYRPGLLVIAPPALAAPDRDAIVAHELAHHVLGHEPLPVRPGSPLDDRDAQARREVDANAKSVEILVRVKGWSEPTALRVVYDKLLRQHRAFAAGDAILAPGHRPPCEEIRDLLDRFPQHRTWTAALECA